MENNRPTRGMNIPVAIRKTDDITVGDGKGWQNVRDTFLIR